MSSSLYKSSEMANIIKNIKKAIPASFGDNPNYIEIIEGTLSNPWGKYNLNQIYNDLSKNNISCFLNFSRDSGVGFFTPMPMFAKAQTVGLIGRDTLSGQYLYEFLILEWNDEDGFTGKKVLCPDNSSSIIVEGVEDLASMNCTIKIVHHSMTDALRPADNLAFGGNT